jgi:hypothetical protein
MSASPVARQVTQSQVIPSRRMVISSASDLPNDYSTTPGGTFYSTTPGGTRIVYERNFLMQLRNSPMAKTPPKNLQYIPGFSPTKQSGLCDNNNTHKLAERKVSPDDSCTSSVAQTRSARDSELFEMDL